MQLNNKTYEKLQSLHTTNAMTRSIFIISSFGLEKIDLSQCIVEVPDAYLHLYSTEKFSQWKAKVQCVVPDCHDYSIIHLSQQIIRFPA